MLICFFNAYKINNKSISDLFRYHSFNNKCRDLISKYLRTFLKFIMNFEWILKKRDLKPFNNKTSDMSA